MSTSVRQLTGETDRITRAIFEHASLISREQLLEELVRLNAEFARDLAQAQHCSLWLVDENKEQLWTQVVRSVAPIRIPSGEGAVGRCVGEEKVLLVNDALDGDVSSPHWITGFATQQMLCMPMRVEGRVIGALEVPNKPSGFTAGDIREHRNSPVKTLPAALCAHADAWTAGAEQYDDMTVVGLRVRA